MVNFEELLARIELALKFSQQAFMDSVSENGKGDYSDAVTARLGALAELIEQGKGDGKGSDQHMG